MQTNRGGPEALDRQLAGAFASLHQALTDLKGSTDLLRDELSYIKRFWRHIYPIASDLDATDGISFTLANGEAVTVTATMLKLRHLLLKGYSISLFTGCTYRFLVNNVLYMTGPDFNFPQPLGIAIQEESSVQWIVANTSGLSQTFFMSIDALYRGKTEWEYEVIRSRENR